MRVLFWLLALSASAPARTHTVKPGEVLAKIALRYHCSVEEIKAANHLPSDVIGVGQKIKIPKCNRKGIHVVRGGDSLYLIARRYGCKISELKAVNQLEKNRLNVGDALKIPACSGPKDASAAPRRSTNKASEKKSKANDKNKDTEAEKPQKTKKGKKPELGYHKTDTETLERLLRERGFYPPKGFKALIIEITLDHRQQRIIRERPFSWRNTYDDWERWNPASTVKLFAAVSALELVRAKGFNPFRTTATFFDRGGRYKRDYKVSDLIYEAIDKSNNIAYNRLVQLAGHGRLNGQFLTPRRGVKHSGIHKPYERKTWIPMTGVTHFKDAPKIQLKEGERLRTLNRGTSKGDWTCPYSGACSTPEDLASVMRRLMLHEQIPPSQRYHLTLPELRVIRRALSQRHKRGEEVVDAIKAAYRGKKEIAVFHKPGYSERWISDVIYVMERRSRRRWIIALAGFPGRGALIRAGQHIGALLASDGFMDE